MTPSAPPLAQADAGTAGGDPAVSACPQSRLSVLAKRADFLRAARARRQGAAGFLLQARRRAGDEAAQGIRVGYTCSKKIGNAVTRNRAKRRLRAAARQVLPALGRDGWDYVLVGRPGATVDRPFADLVADLQTALARVHAVRERGA
ncbi:ribonuclease P [Defluviimonas sp. 20V17]|uniref:Ribonuclease P protein component n=1 Tax=Allgaiera indica TaxID=765699 RepID=A0AAN4USE3_9RHOB|nr:ribonuclease P protein component [Allgaiera indica]KDB02425.1 ribonuclease P [Defluviimonas sp. 20V17]GHE02089.1 ribonuclease P protein component [Allgaiera indica]SDX04658.1 ribonuclease P protein component [Allgaiera indica]